eukprot:scaffold4399_cov175-Ochromonas_danica.AAC.10
MLSSENVSAFSVTEKLKAASTILDNLLCIIPSLRAVFLCAVHPLIPGKGWTAQRKTALREGIMHSKLSSMVLAAFSFSVTEKVETFSEENNRMLYGYQHGLSSQARKGKLPFPGPTVSTRFP